MFLFFLILQRPVRKSVSSFLFLTSFFLVCGMFGSKLDCFKRIMLPQVIISPLFALLRSPIRLSVLDWAHPTWHPRCACGRLWAPPPLLLVSAVEGSFRGNSTHQRRCVESTPPAPALSAQQIVGRGVQVLWLQ